MAKAKLTRRDVAWTAHAKKMGNEVRVTKNGHPYAVLKNGGGKVQVKK